jgi:hypothetical protein
VIDARDLRQKLRRYFDLSDDISVAELLFDHREIFADRIADVIDRLRLGSSLGPATGEPRDRDAIALFRTLQRNPVSHGKTLAY